MQCPLCDEDILHKEDVVSLDICTVKSFATHNEGHVLKVQALRPSHPAHPSYILHEKCYGDLDYTIEAAIENEVHHDSSATGVGVCCKCKSVVGEEDTACIMFSGVATRSLRTNNALSFKKGPLGGRFLCAQCIWHVTRKYLEEWHEFISILVDNIEEDEEEDEDEDDSDEEDRDIPLNTAAFWSKYAK
jgi:hypothetical protein